MPLGCSFRDHVNTLLASIDCCSTIVSKSIEQKMAVFSMKLIVLAVSCASSAATNMKDNKLRGKECLVPMFYEECELALN